MPKVEQFGANKQNLSFAPGAQAPTRSLDKFAGAQLAKGVGDLGKAAAFIADDLTSTQAEDALVQFKRDTQSILHDPESGYLTTTGGKTAVDDAQNTSDAVEALRKSYTAGLSGAARDKFDRVAKGHVTGAMDKIMLHAAQGQHDYKIATNKALIVNTMEEGAVETDPIKRNDQMQLGLSHVRDGNEFNGLTGPAAQKNIDDYKSSFHSAVMTTMADTPGRASEALDYFKAHKGELNHDDKIKMRDMVQQAGLLEFTQGKTDEILSKYSDARAGLAAARKESNPEKRKALVASVRSRYDEKEVLKKRAESDHFDAMVEKASRGEVITAAERSGMSPGERSALDKTTARAVSGAPVITDQAVYGELVLMPTPELAKITPQEYFTKYHDKLSSTDYKSGLTSVKAARAALTNDKSSIHRVTLSFDAAFKNVAAQNGFINAKGTKSFSKDKFAQWARIKDAATSQISEFESRTGKKATSEDMKKIIQQLFNDEVFLNPGSFSFNKELPLAATSVDDRGKLFVKVGDREVKLDSVPMQDRAQIVDAYTRKLGREPTQQEIIEKWLQRKGELK